MFEIDQSLAQEIVNRAMAILPCNVNVMDSQGLILGSGDPTRINTRHEGAQLVLTNSRAVEIGKSAATALRNVNEGVNLPLCLDGHVIGVIGVSGDPDQVRTFAELVKMTAEMLVAQRYDQQHRRWVQERNEDLLASLLLGSQPPHRFIEEARRVGLKPDHNRTPVLVEVTQPDQLDSVKSWLQQRNPAGWCIAVHDTCLAWCPTVPIDESLRLQFETQGRSVERVVIGPATNESIVLREVMLQLSDLAAYGREQMPELNWLLLSEHRIPAALWRYRHDSGIQDLIRPYARLQQKDSNGQLLKTLRTWFDHAGDGTACADALNIHRNSLRNRMERIAEHSEVDPSSPDGMVMLYLGMCLGDTRSNK